MLEMALVLPLLLMLVLGTLEFGLVFARYQILLNSAREGARVASLFRPNCNSRRVKRDVAAAVMSTGNQLGMFLLPTSVHVSGACSANDVTVNLTYRHYIIALGGFAGTGPSIPLDVSIMMRNETS